VDECPGSTLPGWYQWAIPPFSILHHLFSNNTTLLMRIPPFCGGVPFFKLLPPHLSGHPPCGRTFIISCTSTMAKILLSSKCELLSNSFEYWTTTDLMNALLHFGPIQLMAQMSVSFKFPSLPIIDRDIRSRTSRSSMATIHSSS
jgi:hypothetical protein